MNQLFLKKAQVYQLIFYVFVTQILSMEQQANSQNISAYVPLGETFQYATTLRSLTTGRASFSMELDHYAKVPNHIADEISGSKGKES